MDEDLKLLARADPAFQQSLQSEVELDPMEGEQTWPTDEELRQAEGVLLVRVFHFNLVQRLEEPKSSLVPAHNSGFCNMNLLALLLFPLDGMLVQNFVRMPL